MSIEKRKVWLLNERENLKKKGNNVRLVALVMLVVILLSYYMSFYVIPICVTCIIIAFVTFVFVGFPIQKKLRMISKELKGLVEE